MFLPSSVIILGWTDGNSMERFMGFKLTLTNRVEPFGALNNDG